MDFTRPFNHIYLNLNEYEFQEIYNYAKRNMHLEDSWILNCHKCAGFRKSSKNVCVANLLKFMHM